MREIYEQEVIDILLADIHLSLKPPIWRSAEPDWFEAMRRPLDEVKALQDEFDCPILCAGDIFDKWNSSPELINFAIRNLPEMYSIPGQHDLPLHNYEDINRSAYLTLVYADKIQNVLPDCNVEVNNILVRGFPYGYEVTQCPKKRKGMIHLALIHDYLWMHDKSYPNAPKENQLRTGHWKGYDVQVYGDNHKGFLKRTKPVRFFNCGTLMRRKSDEINYKPQVGLLLEDGSVEPHYLDTSQDKYIDIPEATEEGEFDMKAFIKELEELGDTALDFVDAMKQYIRTKKISPEAKTIILEAMGM